MSSFINFKNRGLILFLFICFTFQSALAQYTLQDDDVVITGGVISSCIYDFSSKDIIIPETLQGQAVTGIADASAYNTGVFYDKGITSIVFPSSIQFIGSNSFRLNAISTIDLSNLSQLQEIRSAAFIQNTATTIDLSNCSSLLSIGTSAFQICDIISVNFTGCSSLQTIGEQAFYDNVISNLDLSSLTGLQTIGNRAFWRNSIANINFNNCTSLEHIGDYVFGYNSFTAIDITPCTGLMSIGLGAFNYNSITSFVLPVVIGYEENGWRNNSNQVFAGGDATTNLTASYFVPIPHTLTDEEVVVTDGMLTSCSYSFASKDIIIPDTLDGQAVTGLKGGTYTNNGVFSGQSIFSVVLPATLEVIEQNAFYGNKVRTLNLSRCPSIREIQTSAFPGNSMVSLNLNGCSNLKVIGDYAFSGNSIDSLDFSSCTSLKTIGTNAFYQQPTKSLDLSNCSSLERIYDRAFYYHNATSVDLSDCSSLIYIGYSALRGSTMSSLQLPTPTAYESLGWRDSNYEMHNAGETVTNLSLSYKVPVPYIFTDNDVVVTDSIITSCSYDFFFTDIIIPDTLDDQLVTGIANGTSSAAVFSSKKITSVQLPSGLKSIGNYAFYNNKITEVNLSVCPALQTVGNYAFSGNLLNNMDLNCPELRTIGSYAFAGSSDGTKNNLTALDISNCTKLESIGSFAFSDNSISSVDFSSCINLHTIGDYAFLRNSLSSLDITNCSSLLYIGTYCFASNSLSSFVLPVVSGYESNGWRDGSGTLYMGGQTVTDFTTYYKVPLPYTLTDDDVEVTNGEIVSCSYNFASKDIIIPDTLDGQAVTGIADGAYSTGIFIGKGLFTIQIPTTIQKVGTYAFRDNNLKSLDFTNTDIKIIGDYAFRDNNLDYLNFSNTGLISIGSYAFEYNNIDSINFTACTELQNLGTACFISNNLQNINLSTCPGLKTIGNNAFESNYNLANVNLSGCDSLQTIGGNAFYRCALTAVDLSTCPKLITIGGSAFYDNNISALNLNNCVHLKTIGSNAFYGNALTAVDLSVCDSLQTIGDYAFRSNTLTSVNLSCPLLETIGQNAFYTNSLANVDLSNCTSLTLIAYGAFMGNSLTGFDLPAHNQYSSLGWRDGNNAIYAAGSTTTTLNTLYEIPVPHTLTDEDVVVSNGVITNCSYNFEKKDIIIPDTLHSQAITATLNAGSYSTGLFYNQGIKTLKFPSTIESIGNYSLYNNGALYQIDLSECTKLKTIGNEAFKNCYELSQPDFSSCSSLTSIGTNAFYRIAAESLSFAGCSSLKSIGNYAFNSITNLSSVSFSGCDSLESIGSYSFAYNSNLNSIDLSVCPRLSYINTYAFYGCGLSGFNLPSVIGYEEYGWRDASNNSYASGASVSNLTTWYKAAIPYTLTDDDVVVTNGEIVSCSYSFAQNDIIIPDTLDGQKVIGIKDAPAINQGVFYQKNVYTVKFPSALQNIGQYAFYDSNLKSIDLTDCTGIKSIGNYAFFSCTISDLQLDSCAFLTNIGDYAFDGNALASLEITHCKSLIKIGNRAFYGNSIPQFTLPVVEGYEMYGWRDGLNNSYNCGDIVSNLNTYYEVPLPYVLADTDVTMSNGLITGCSYGFAQKDIVIPDTLQGQKVLGIANAGSYSSGIFYNEGIKTVQFPDNIEIIGNYAFHTNSIYTLDLSKCSKLKTIGDYAFTSNASLTGVDLSQCTSLEYIGAYGLKTNGLNSFTLPTNTEYESYGWVDQNGNSYTGEQTVTNLTIYYKVPVPYTLIDEDVVVTDGVIVSCSYDFATKDIIIPDTLNGQAVIGIAGNSSYDLAIFYNKGITSIQFPSHLEYIGSNAFYFNKISKIDLLKCSSLKTLESFAFYYNSIKNIDLSACTSLAYIGMYAFGQNPLTSFILPVNTKYEELGWRDTDWNYFEGGETVNKLTVSYKVPVPYTLTDEDVEVTDGVITSCSYSFEIKDIIIPDTLDGQFITSIPTSLTSTTFRYKYLTSVQLPSGLQIIGDNAFEGNDIYTLHLTGNQLESIGKLAFASSNLDTLDFSGCPLLTSIGDYAFSNNQIVQINLTNCASLESIGIYTFQNNDISGLDFSDCSSLTTIGQNAFYYNEISTLNLSGCSKLSFIGNSAFYSNKINSLDLSPCISLTFIGTSSFYGNNITGFALPTPNIPGFTLSYWKDDADNHYNGGDFAANLNTNYNAVLAQALLANFYVSDGVNPLAGVNIELHGYDTLMTDESGLAQFTVMTTDSIGYTAKLAGFLTVTDSISAHDSVINEYVVMQPCSDSVELNENLCEGESFTLGSSTYFESGIYTESFINQSGCDSIVTLHLTINPGTSETVYDTICTGDFRTLADSSYYETGVFTHTYSNTYGCDSTIILNLTVYPVDSLIIDKTICEGDNYVAGDGAVLTKSGTHTSNLSNRFGCDSIVTVNLTVIPTDTVLTEVICDGGQITIGNNTYTQSGTYSDTLANRLGCDSIITLNLTVLPSLNPVFSSICTGDSVVIGNSVYKQQGIYTDTLINQLGCDSVVILDLTVNKTDTVTVIETVCEGESVQLGDSVYSQTGSYSSILSNQHGCDSIINLQLTVNPVQRFITDAEICEGETYLFQNQYYDTQGKYADTLTNQYGCDSIYTLNLTVHPTDRMITRDTITYGDTFSFRGETYSSSGLYSDTLTNQLGCDSIISLLLYVYYEPVVYIPDHLFKAELLGDTLINTNKDDEIQVIEAEAYAGKIDVSGKSIESFTGIEAFKNIDSLICTNNLADSLDLSVNTKLVYVDCSNNNIEFLVIDNLILMTELDISGNELNEVQLDENAELEILNCSNNQLSSLDLSVNNKLTELNCSGNVLTGLDLRNGNNINLSVLATGNPELTCVTVDNVIWANENWSASFDAGILFSTDCNAPDIAVQDIEFEPGDVYPGDELTVSWKVINYGNSDATGGWNERISLVSSAGQKLQLNGNIVYSNALGATAVVSRSAKLTIPALTNFGGPAHVLVELIPTGALISEESVSANNKLMSDSTVTLHELLSFNILEVSVFENYTRTLRGTVSRSGNSDTTLTVNLSTTSSDLTIPASVKIAAGNNAANFYFTLINNNLFDGIRLAEVTASANGLEPVSDKVEILDDDVPALYLTIDRDSCTEGEFIHATITSDIALDTAHTILLSANKTGQLSFPSSLTIPANNSSVQMDINVTDDSKPELDQNLILTVSASGYISGKDTIFLADNDIPEIELELLADTVSESAGENATWLKVTRNKDSEETITVALSTVSSSEVVVPQYVHFFPGEMEKQTDVDVTDNDQVDGYRNVSVIGAVYIPTCNCNSPVTGRDTTVLVLADDDGPALKLTCNPVTLSEGQTNQGMLTITRNTPGTMALLVYLTTNNPGELQLQDTVSIPAGSSSVQVPVMALNDLIDDGQQTVIIKASAQDFSPGMVTVYTTDQNKPDLIVSSFTTTDSELPVGSILEFQATIKNTGFLDAPAGITVCLYLSTDKKVSSGDVLLESFTTENAIPIGDSTQLWELVAMPESIGTYFLILKVNPNQSLTELLYTNNASSAVPVTIQSNYTATAIVDEDAFTSAQAFTIRGSATGVDATPASNKEVEVYVITQGIRRTVSTTTNASGEYSVVFVPGENEVGHYTVGACHPDENLSAAQDEFDIMGFGRTSNEWLIWYLQKGETITGSFTVKNYSNAELTNLSLELSATPAGFSLDANKISVLDGNGTATFNFSVTGNTVTEVLDYIQIPIKITSDQGVYYQFKALYFCQAVEGLLKTEPVNLETSFTKGKIRYVEFYIYNIGAGNSGSITISLPDVDWMSFASPAVIDNIAPGGYSKVTLRLQSTDDTPLNFPMTGQIAINALNADGLALPYRIECVPEETGNLLVDVVDEYTYNTAEGPHLAGAHVKVSNPYTGVVAGEGYTNTYGQIEFANIPEGTYILLVEADNHDGSRQTIIINPGQTTEKLVFISFQAISYTWTVVPTEIEDEYEIQLNIVYETNVPKPVVTLDIPTEMPVLETGETFSFMAKLTNHGLITAEDLDLGFPIDDAEYEFVFQDKKYNIPAKESIEIPVVMQRKYDLKSSRITSFISGQKEATTPVCHDVSDYEYGWQCGPDKKYEMYKKPYTYKRCDDNDNDGDSNDGGDGGDGTFPSGTDINTLLGNIGRQTSVPTILGEMGMALPGLDGVVEVIAAGSGTSGYDPTSTDVACEPCLTEIAKFAVGKLIPGAGLVLNVSSCFDTYNKIDATNKDVFDCLLSMAPTALKDELEKQLSLIGDVNSLINIAITCYDDPPGMPLKSATEVKPDMPALLKQSIQDLMYVQLIMEARMEWLDEFWNPIDWKSKNNLSDLAEKISLFVSNHNKFSEQDILNIKYTLLNTDISSEEIDTFTSRWNSTIDAWNEDIFVPNETYPDILDGSIADYCIEKADTVTHYLESRGYLTVNELFDDAATVLNEQIEDHQNSVCASVTLSISQKLVMTREAFRGTLTIKNGHETMPIKEFQLNLEITNESGELCNDLFEIETESLLQLTGIDGSGTLPAMETGTATILFIPEKAAAPTVTQSYSFGGSITYLDPFTQTTVTKPLFPVTLEVHPSPDLYLHYFMQRDILGDDPLTVDVVEPIVPGELALMIENNGYGDAKNIRIESAQPEIVDNEKGLLIKFEMIGSNLQGVPVNLGLINIDFGTVLAQSAKVGQWWFTSGLLGHFVNYEAKLTHLDSRGNPGLSLVSGAQLHELIRSVSVYGALDDGINDFLVNDIPDSKETPDAIYLSQGQTVLDVYESAGGSFDQEVKAPAFTNTLTYSPVFKGWNYLKLDDPGDGMFKIASVTRNSDGQQIPLDNAWLTYITLPDGKEHIYENKFHIVDNFETMTPQSYTIVWAPSDTIPVEVVEVRGATSNIVTSPVNELTVIFNKEIDPASLTFKDISLTLNGSADLSDNSIVISQIDDVTYKINIESLTSGDGTYEFTILTGQINDKAGNNGNTDKTISWSQYMTVPAVEQFIGVPASKTSILFDEIQIRFNMEIDASTFTSIDCKLERNNTLIPASLTIQQVSGSFTDFKISGFASSFTHDGEYKLYIDLTGIRSLYGIYGTANQFANWTFDTTPPEVVQITRTLANQIDAQHVTGLKTEFSEGIQNFSSEEYELRRNGVLLSNPLNSTVKLSSSVYKVSGFDMLTYPEGNYVFKVKTDAISDEAGNTGIQANNENEYRWSVDRTPPPAISNLSIQPDFGISNTDKISSGDSLTLSMNIHEDNARVSVFLVDGQINKTLLSPQIVNSGNFNVPLRFENLGNIKLQIVCADSMGNPTNTNLLLYLDNTDLAATISGAPLTKSETHPDSLLVEFSDNVFADDFTTACLAIHCNNSPVNTDGLTIQPVNHKTFSIKGLQHLPLRDGSYSLGFSLGQIREELSGKPGKGIVKTSWNIEIPNNSPVASAGDDIKVTQGQMVSLDGSASYDPDNDPITYQWYCPQGIVLNNENSEMASFVAPYAKTGTTYTFMLAVNDGKLIQTDKTIVTIDKAVVVDSVTATICSNETYQLGDLTISESGVYVDTLAGNDGADSIVHLSLTVNPADTVFIDEFICTGEAVSIGDSLYDETGTFETFFLNQYGCDSLVVLNLTVNRADTIHLSEDICEGESFSIGQHVYTESGIFTTTLTNRYLCDSVIILDLYVHSTDTIKISASICYGETYNFHGNNYNQSGVYNSTVISDLGCDWISQLTLTVLPEINTVIEDSVYFGETYQFGDTIIDREGEYVQTFTAKNGCDSIVHLQLFVRQNQPPVIQNAVMDLSMKVGDSIMAILDLANNVFYDENDTALSYTYTVSPEQHNWIDDTLSEGLLVFNLVPSIQDTGCYTVVIQATDPWSQTVNDTFNICVIPNYDGINEWAAPKPVFKIYPNPSADRVTIEFQAPLNNKIEICIYNNAGENIFRKFYDKYSESIVLNVTEYVSGIYLVTVSSEKQRFSRKLIINKNR